MNNDNNTILGFDVNLICDFFLNTERQGYGRKLINYLINHYSKEYTQMIVGTGDVPGVLAFYKSCGFEYSHCIKGFFTENYDHPIIDNGILLKDMIYLKRKIGF